MVEFDAIRNVPARQNTRRPQAPTGD